MGPKLAAPPLIDRSGLAPLEKDAGDVAILSPARGGVQLQSSQIVMRQRDLLASAGTAECDPVEQEALSSSFHTMLKLHMQVHDLFFSPGLYPTLEHGSLAALHRESCPETERKLVRSRFDQVCSLLVSIAAELKKHLPQDSELPSSIRNAVEIRRQAFESEIFNAPENVHDYDRIFLKHALNLDPHLCGMVRADLFGFMSESQSVAARLVKNTTSLNEVLHVTHAFLLRDQNLHEHLTKWQHFEPHPGSGGYYAAFGQATDEGRAVFEALKSASKEIDAGWIIMFSFEKITHITVRDRGHATSILLTPFEDQGVFVNWFVPKTFGEESVRHLPGFDRHDDFTNTASGHYIVRDPKRLGPEIVRFITEVPTDYWRPSQAK